MAHFAELNENNEVIYVCYIPNECIIDKDGNEVEQLGINHLHLHHGSERKWVQTSRTRSFRKNWASIGYIYREDIDAFVPPNPPHPSWILNENIGLWEPPINKPELDENQLNDGLYCEWNEENLNWEIKQY